MSETASIEPILHEIDYDGEVITKLPSDKPWAISDLDGTQTKKEKALIVLEDGRIIEGKGLLLMERFVNDVEDVGDPRVREQLKALFAAWHKGELKYDPYLGGIANHWAKMLYVKKETRARVREMCEKWATPKTISAIMEPYAPLIARELDTYLFNTMLFTGCPGEIAAPMAAHMRVKHVIAMMAEVNSDGVYCSDRIPKALNTGIRDIKAKINNRLSDRLALGLGFGDTLSDSGIAIPVINKNPNNERDLEGCFLLMNVSESDNVLDRMTTTFSEYYNNDRIIAVDSGADLDKVLRRVRMAIERVFELNHKTDLYDEIRGKRNIPPEELDELKKQRALMKNPWNL